MIGGITCTVNSFFRCCEQCSMVHIPRSTPRRSDAPAAPAPAAVAAMAELPSDLFAERPAPRCFPARGFRATVVDFLKERHV